MQKITKSLFLKYAREGINFHGSCFITTSELKKTIDHVKKNINSSNSKPRALINSCLTSLQFETQDGYSYLDLSGENCTIGKYQNADRDIFIVTDKIDRQINLIVYSAD